MRMGSRQNAVRGGGSKGVIDRATKHRARPMQKPMLPPYPFAHVKMTHDDAVCVSRHGAPTKKV